VSTTIRLLLFLLLAMATIAGCAPAEATPVARDPASSALVAASPEPTRALPDREGLSPVQVTRAFYEWYIAVTAPGVREEPLGAQVLRDSGYLDAALVDKIDHVWQNPDSFRADPVLLAQDLPKAVYPELLATEADRAKVLVTSDLIGHRIEVTLRQLDGVWQIDQISLDRPNGEAQAPAAATPAPAGGTSQADAPAGWQTYRNDRFAFAFDYPAGWRVEEILEDPNQPPIGAPNVRMILMFWPQDWDLDVPFQVEVTQGSLEEYRANYMEPIARETREVDGLVIEREVEGVTDEITIVRHLVQNPADDALRLTFMDMISGFPERASGREAAVALLEDVVVTVTFDE
jgi:hypothetical protein